WVAQPGTMQHIFQPCTLWLLGDAPEPLLQGIGELIQPTLALNQHSDRAPQGRTQRRRLDPAFRLFCLSLSYHKLSSFPIPRRAYIRMVLLLFLYTQRETEHGHHMASRCDYFSYLFLLTSEIGMENTCFSPEICQVSSASLSAGRSCVAV